MKNWHDLILNKLLLRQQHGRLPHALLFCGPEGIGEWLAATRLAAALLCTARSAAEIEVCGQCQGCRLLHAGTHPDFYSVLPEVQDEKQAKAIKIDQVRQLTQHLNLKSHQQGLKIALIYPAERLNRNAANSLLKTLEEPPPDSLLILISAYPGRLSATIRSRCQQIKLHPPSPLEVTEWLHGLFPEQDSARLLAAAGGSPQMAYQLAEQKQLDDYQNCFEQLQALQQGRQDPAELARQYAMQEWVALLFDWWLFWLQDMIKLKLGTTHTLQNPHLRDGLQHLANHSQLSVLFLFQRRLIEARLLLSGSVNLQLLLESTLLSWSAVMAGQSTVY